jgi:hypothetical protein
MNGGAKQAGGFSYPHTLKLYKCPGENVAGTSRDFTTFVPHWPHYVGNFTDSFHFIILQEYCLIEKSVSLKNATSHIK